MLSAGVALPDAARAEDWTGATSNDWFVTGNWHTGVVPTASTDARIDTTTPNPTVVDAANAAAQNLYLGTSSSVTGTLTISNGGSLSDIAGFIGNHSGSSGAVTVNGGGSNWSNSSGLFIGDSGTGALTISNGATVSNDQGHIGLNSGSSGAVTVTGAGSTWFNSSALVIGNSGTGALTIANGGTVSSNFGAIGNTATGTGTVTVNGAGAGWMNSGNLNVGELGAGRLTILNGGTVSNAFGTVGNAAGASGTVVVDGAGSTWANNGDLSIGWNGTGTLAITNGGKVNSDFGGLGVNGGSSGAATVSGAGSTWINVGNLIAGIGGGGILTVKAGGAASNMDGILGYDAGSSGTAVVDGAGSTWTNGGAIMVGRNGTGTLTISNSGVVTVGSVVTIAKQTGSTGTLNIGGAAGSAATAAGALKASSIQFGSGTGTINFNHTDTNYVFASAISGLGTINQIAGNTNLTADSTGFTGTAYVTGGRLAVNGSLANSLVTVSGGGVLGGNGIVGGVVANAGGIIGPGNSIGTLTINGNITQTAGSTYQVELTSTGQSDRINAIGLATIANGATLNIVKLDAAPYVVGTHYTVLQADGGVGGTYTLTGNTKLSAFIGLIDTYDATHVYLDVAQTKPFASVGLTPNQIAAGAGVESLGNRNPIYDAVIWLPTDGAARYAFDQLSGEIHASAKTVLIEDSRFLRNAVNDRLRAAFGTVGASADAVATYDYGQRRAAAATTDSLAVWGQGFGSWGRNAGDGNAARLNRSTGGFFIGADAPVFDSWRFGAVAGYSRTSFDMKDRHSSGSSDNYHLGLYGGTTWGDLAFRTGAAYTWHDISTGRSVVFPGFGDSLKGGYNAATAQAFGELGYRMQAGNVALEPLANLAYVNLHTDGFTEKGGAAALTDGSANTDATFTTLGLRASTSFDLNGTTVTANGMLGWRHAYGNVTPNTTMRFAGGGDAFSIGGVPIARNAAVVEAGLDFALSPTAMLGVSYGGQFGSGAIDQTFRANFNVKF